MPLAHQPFNYIDRQVLAAVVPNIRDHFFGPSAEPGAVARCPCSWMVFSMHSVSAGECADRNVVDGIHGYQDVPL